MASDQVIILFRRLRSNYLLISVGNSEKLQQQFLDYVELGLEVNIGPLVGLLDTDPSSVTLGWNFLKSLAEKRCFHGDNKIKGRSISRSNKIESRGRTLCLIATSNIVLIAHSDPEIQILYFHQFIA
ncbi:hypothetical protein Y032_0072g665 [Ancylostoma ceylanicum]|nr:hypothetical protein Y032_0072g665 [Ancylostoma ceylanicum]